MSNEPNLDEYNEERSLYFKANLTPMLPNGTFNNKLAYITGGGTGLGKSMAIMLSKLGANVIIVSRKQEVLEKAVKEIETITGKRIAYYAADIRDANQVTKSVDYCEQAFGKLPDIIINNAAANFISPTERLSLNAFKTIVDIVLYGTINVSIIIGKRLIEQKKGASFLSILATYVFYGSGYVVPSAIAKTGVAALTRSLAAEWAKYGIRFNAIAPGPIYTEGAFSRLDPTGEFSKSGPKKLPIGRFGKPEELSNLAAYTVSDYSNWLTGEIIVFDGGELVNKAGEFNELSKIENSQWDLLEQMIKSTNRKSKL